MLIDRPIQDKNVLALTTGRGSEHIISLAVPSGSMKRILCFDWLPVLHSHGSVAKNLKEKESSKIGAFFDEFWVSCSDSKKQRGKFIVESFFWLSRLHPFIAYYLGRKKFRKKFSKFCNIYWSYDKMLIDWVGDWGPTVKYLALGHDALNSLP